MKKILLLLCFVLTISSVLGSCDNGCENGADCVQYGDVVSVGPITYYCELNGSLMQQKTSGVCLNEFECVSGYNCLDEICTDAYNYFIQGYNAIIANVSGLCYGEDYFCSNVSVSNATILGSKDCSFSGTGFSCYECNNNFYYNSSLGKCITGICSASPGCLSNSSINNASMSAEYCADDKKCFSCDSDFEWNTTTNSCKMKQCASSPGCTNISNLTNGVIVSSRYCSTGTCFACNPCYVWNVNFSSCIYSSSCSYGNINWSSVYFSSSDLSSGVYKLLSPYDKVDFTFQGRNYRLGVLGVDFSKVVFKIEYTGVSNYNLFSNASAGFDLSGDGVNDIRVSVAGISNGKANMSIKFLTASDVNDGNDDFVAHDQQGTSGLPQGSNTGTSGSGDVLGEDSSISFFDQKTIWIWVVIGLIILILIIILIIYLVGSKKKNEDSAPSGQAYKQQPPPVAPANTPMTYPVGGVPVQQQNMQSRRM